MSAKRTIVIFMEDFWNVATHRIWAIARIDARSIKQEANGCHLLALAIAESIHELLESGGSLDLEEDLVVVICDLDVEVFRLRLLLSVAPSVR